MSKDDDFTQERAFRGLQQYAAAGKGLVPALRQNRGLNQARDIDVAAMMRAEEKCSNYKEGTMLLSQRQRQEARLAETQACT